MTQIGFIGTENSHVEHFIRFLNVERRHPGVVGAALAGGPTGRNRELAALGGIDVIVGEPAELVGTVDAAVVSTRDGARHLEHARPLLEAGIPVLVDKPLAASVKDADALIAVAREHGAPLVSCSALRFVPEIAELKAARSTSGELRHLHIAGPADPDSEYSGLFFYGVHHVEAALEILGNPVVDTVNVVVSRQGDTTVASCRISQVQLTFTFVAPRGEERVPFHATAVHTDGVVARELTLGPDYNAPALEELLRTIGSGAPRLGTAQLRSPVVVLSAVVAALGSTAP